MTSSARRVVVVHDYATQRGGAERVALDLLRSFPGSRLVTSCWDPAGTYPDFADFDVETLWPNRVGALRRDPRRAFPVLASAFERHVIADADVVICSSSGWAHRVGSSAPKLVYCYNPARWLYQPRDYFGSRMPAAARTSFVNATGSLRRSDLRHALGADRYLVTSSAVAGRVEAAYGIVPSLVPPARGIDPAGRQQPVRGLEPGFLLTISRPRQYKHIDVVCDAMAELPGMRLVVVGARTHEWPLSVTGLDDLNDDEMRWLYANAAGLVAVAHEDFGLTPIEAMSFGVPSVVLRGGGYLDTCIEGVTSVFVDEPNASRVAAGVRELTRRHWDPNAIRKAGQRYSREAFAGRMHDEVDAVIEGRRLGTPPMSRVRQAGSVVPHLRAVPGEGRSA